MKNFNIDKRALHILLKKSFSNRPSPSLVLKKMSKSPISLHLENDRNDIFFDVIIKEVSKGVKKCIFLGLNLTTNKIFMHEYVEANTSNRLLKTFIAKSLTGLKANNIQLNNIYIPKRITSKNLTTFLAICFKEVNTVWYLKSDVKNLFSEGSYIHFKKTLINLTPLTIRTIFKNINIFNDVEYTPSIERMQQEPNIINQSVRSHHTVANDGINKAPIILDSAVTSLMEGVNKSKNNRKWNTYSSGLKYECIDRAALRIEIDKFLEHVINNYNGKYVISNSKIAFTHNQEIRSLGTVNITLLSDRAPLYEFLTTYLERADILSAISYDNGLEEESTFPRGHMIFDFLVLDTLNGTKYENYKLPTRNIIRVKDINKDISLDLLNIPKTMDINAWDTVKFINRGVNKSIFTCTVTDYNNKGFDIVGHVTHESGTINVIVQRASNNSIVNLLEYTDTMENSNDPTTFKRVVNEKGVESTRYYENSILKYTASKEKIGFINKIKKDHKLNLKAISTLDLETKMNSNNELIPICMSYYNNNKMKTFIFKDKWEDDMLVAFKTLLKSTNHNKKFYVHNFSNFDSIFVIDTLSKLGQLKIIKRQDKIMKLTLTYKIKEDGPSYKIKIYDSLLILPASLRQLCGCFKVEDKKLVFPLKFADGDNTDFNYIGKVPPYNDFYNNSFSIMDYQEYCNNYNNDWDFCKELAKYCETDCLALHQVLTKFAESIHGQFGVDITNYVSLSSIAFAIYRSNFLIEGTIPNIKSNKLHYLFKDSYTGGFCDTYRAHGKNIHSFDINSLYPSAMFYFDMPTGSPTHIVGDPYEYTKNPFGFVYAEIKTPNLMVPILQVRLQTSGGVRTIAPVGTWSSWYFLDELENAKKHGYEYTIKEAYLFEKTNIFKEYIEVLYKIKSTYPSDHPMYFIAKLLMNALYGRFGMDPITEEHSIVSPEQSEKIIRAHKNVVATTLPSGNALLKYNVNIGENSSLNTSVVISSAIAAYSRIIMTKYMIEYADNIYAIDTDGIKVDVMIDSKYISDSELGLMKHEYTFKEAVFLAPKVYGGLLDTPYKNKTEIVKVKGLKTLISFSELKSVLPADSFIVLHHDKFFKEINLSRITIKNQEYTLRISSLKRNPIFKDGKLSYTTPLIVQDGVILDTTKYDSSNI